ncbi:CotH kinase family protein, partial [Pelagibacteraceae bacterium]|nr:CotH kinase family protein [Pelagibacteraceae bacterium]
MKKLLKELIFYSMPFLGLILILFFINIFKKDFMYGHYLHSTYKGSYNWIYDFTILPINKFYIRVINDNKEYLPQIKLYLSESKLNSFLSDLPKSTKNWQTGKVIHDYDKTNIKDIKIRLRGDNPSNWLLEKQSFRIKLKKNQMHGRYRYYNYLPFEPRTLISNRLAANTKILAAKVRPIELLLNEEKKGLYLELENFNENFLRRNKIMPVNFYKGENYNQEAKIGLGNNLYNNIGLWSKEAYFNFYEKSYKDDLRKFLQILKQSKNNPKKFKELKTYLDEEYFGRYLAYIILSQNYHTTKYHN